MEQYAGNFLARSVYFGGGTPSLMSINQVEGLLCWIKKMFTVQSDPEISFEVNPGTVDYGYLADLRRAGINRISLGAQSFRDEELKVLGRHHTSAEAMSVLDSARKAGFDNISLDLIYGIPGQSLDDWHQTLDRAIKMKPEHMSLYCLSLEEGTPLMEGINSGESPLPDPDISADQYETAENKLGQNGYCQYEISNWARKGRECRHNKVYWRHEPYLGVGMGACSYINNVRRTNVSDIFQYMAACRGPFGAAVKEEEIIEGEVKKAEAVILSLRLNEGVCFEDVYNPAGAGACQHYGQVFNELTGYGLLESDGSLIRLTRKGRLLSNEVFWRLLPD